MALWRQALPAGRDDLCVPQPIRRPPILIAGGGEKKTLRLVAQYAVVWTSTASTVDELKHETDVPNRHCDTVGRNPAEIRKTAGLLSLRRPRRLSEDGAKVRRIGRLLDQCRRDAGQSGPHRVRPAPGRRGRAQAGCDRLARRARIICAARRTCSPVAQASPEPTKAAQEKRSHVFMECHSPRGRRSPGPSWYEHWRRSKIVCDNRRTDAGRDDPGRQRPLPGSQRSPMRPATQLRRARSRRNRRSAVSR
jgi:hypothetical protein